MSQEIPAQPMIFDARVAAEPEPRPAYDNAVDQALATPEPPPVNAIARRRDSELSRPEPAISLPAIEIMEPLLDEYAKRRDCLRSWVWKQMTAGLHYGVPPGCEPKTNGQGQPLSRGKVVTPDQWIYKPTLYAAGAEMIRDLLGTEDAYSPAEGFWKMMGSPAGTVVVRCELRKRKGSPFHPNHADGDLLAEGHGAERMGEYSDPNKTMKIAAKRALVAAAINLAAIRDLFGQDPPKMRQAGVKPDAAVTPTRGERAATPDADITSKLNVLYNRWKEKQLPGDTRKAVDLMPLFATWAEGHLKGGRDYKLPSSWSVDAIELCENALDIGV